MFNVIVIELGRLGFKFEISFNDESRAVDKISEKFWQELIFKFGEVVLDKLLQEDKDLLKAGIFGVGLGKPFNKSFVVIFFDVLADSIK